jgi:nucleotide-binding universal stress UspA family protein
MDVKTDFTCRQGENVTTGILDYSKENSVDLLCTIKRKGNGLINKLFPKSISAEILEEADVPVLVFSGM